MVDAVRELGREVRAMPISVAGCVREDFDHNAENKRNFIIFDIAKVFLIYRGRRDQVSSYGASSTGSALSSAACSAANASWISL